MYKIMLALHIVFAIFAIGPLVHAATTAGRGVRTGNADGVASSIRALRYYSIASVGVVIFGFGLMSADAPWGGKTGEFGQTYIWLSLILWVAAVGVVHALLIPALTNVADKIKAQDSVVTLTVRVASIGGVVGLIFVAIVFLMVYKPGT